MAKQPETIERFMIHAAVEAERLGVVVAALSRLGVTNLQHELIEEVVTFRQNRKKRRKRRVVARKTFDKRGEDVIVSHARSNHGRTNTERLIKVFARQGRARNSVYASLDALMKNKMMKRVGDKGSGQYVLLAKAKTKLNGAAAAETAHG